MKPLVYIPDTTKSTVQAANLFSSISCGMIILVFLIVWRAQFTVTAKTTLDLQKIQSSDTAKWLAKQIAKNDYVRRFISCLVVAETLKLEFRVNPETYKGLTLDAINDSLFEVASELAENPPPPGARILPDSAINDPSSLRFHRHGLLAKKIGILQSRAIYAPNDLVKNVSIANIDSSILCNAIEDLHTNLEVPVDPDFEEVLSSPNRQEKFNGYIQKTLFDSLPAYNQPKFYDGINVGTENNKLPLEFSENITRTSVNKDAQVDPTIPESLKESDSPLLKYILGQGSSENPKKKSQESAPSTPAKPPSKSMGGNNRQGGKNKRK